MIIQVPKEVMSKAIKIYISIKRYGLSVAGWNENKHLDCVEVFKSEPKAEMGKSLIDSIGVVF